MGFLDLFKKKNTDESKKEVKKESNKKGKAEDPNAEVITKIKTSAQWLADTLNPSGYVINYSVDSLKEIDHFFDDQEATDSLLTDNAEQVIFSVGCYIGEVAIKTIGGEWIIKSAEKKDLVNIEVHLESGKTFKPVKQAMKRYANGNEDNIAEWFSFLI
jgi:hypothetical protein